MVRSSMSRRLAVGIATVLALTLAPAAAGVDGPEDTAGRGLTIRTIHRQDARNRRSPSTGPHLRAHGALRRSEGTRNATPVLPSALATIPAISSGMPAPNVPTSFAGLADADNDPYQGAGCAATGCLEPSDPHLAVGPDHVFQVVNTTFRLTDRDGTEVLTWTPSEFFGFNPLYSSVADARVLYDARHNRWLVTELSYDCGDFAPANTFGFIDLAVSNTGDPEGAWTIYELTFPDVLPDYPGLGTSSDKVALSSNNFDIDGFCGSGATYQGAQLFVIDWSQLVAHVADPDIAATSQDDTAFAYRPGVASPARAGQSALPVVFEGGGGDILFTRLTGTIGAGTISIEPTRNLTDGAADLDPFELPPAPEQDGPPATIVDAVDERPTDAVWQDDRFVFVTTAPCDLGGGVQDCVRVVELNTKPSTPTLNQDFVIGESGVDYFMGGVGLSGGGDLHVVYSKSSSSTFVTTESVYQRSSDPLASISDPAELGASTEAYGGTRWGDYVGVAQDPIDSSAVWQGNQHADNSSWVTEVTQMTVDGARYVPITPLRILDSRAGIGIGLSGKFNANSARIVQVTGGTIPAEAIAITGNLTVTRQNASGYVSVTPIATNTPSTSTINFPTGDTRANNLTIPLSRAGTVALVYKAAAGKTTDLILDVTGYFVYDSGAATYVSIPPERTLDSRFGTGVPDTFVNGTPQSWEVGDSCVAAGATDTLVAVTGNLTVVGQTAAGFVSVTPDPDPSPTTSTINVPLGDTRANGVAVQVALDGTLSATYVSSTVGAQADLLFDLTGCFVDSGAGASWFPIEPTRRLDTRVNVGLVGKLVGDVPRQLGLAGAQFLPSTTDGITGNLTVVNQTRAGYVSMTTSSTLPPDTSTINFPLGDVRANGVFAALASGTAWFIYPGSSRTTDVLLDVTGYFR